MRLNESKYFFSGLTNRNLFRIKFKDPYEEVHLRDETTQNIRSVVFSPKGTYLAFRTDKKYDLFIYTNIIIFIKILSFNHYKNMIKIENYLYIYIK